MNAQSADGTQIREYLLGGLPEEQCGEIETKLLTDAEFAKTVELIEEEIIEDYLDGSLSQSEKQAVEGHFLRPPERKRKLWFVRVLRSHATRTAEQRMLWSWGPYIRAHWKMASGVAALFLVSIFLGFYSLELRHDLQSQKDSLEKERRQTAQLQEQLMALQQSTASQPQTEQYLVINLGGGTTRGDGKDQQVPFDPGKSGLGIHVSLIDRSITSYNAVLEKDDTPLWSGTNLKPAPLAKEVVIPIRCKPEPGSYSLVLAATGNPIVKQAYSFRIVK